MLMVAALATVLSPRDVHAQESMTEEERNAKFAELMGQAKEAYTGERYAEAVGLLQAANMVNSDPRLFINIAKSYENLNDCMRAIAYYKAFLRTGGKDPQLEQFTMVAQDGIAKAQPCADYDATRSGRIVVTSQPSGADVTIDGKSVGKTPIETIGYAQAPHSLKIELDGFSTVEQEFRTNGETDQTIDIVLNKATMANNGDPDKKDPDDTKDPIDDPLIPNTKKDGPELNIPAIAIAGVGLVGIIGGAYIDLAVLPELTDARNELPAGDERDALTARRQSRANTALGLYIGGGVLLAGGLGWLGYDLYMSSQEKNKKEVPPIVILPDVSGGRAGLSIIGRF